MDEIFQAIVQTLGCTKERVASCVEPIVRSYKIDNTLKYQGNQEDIEKINRCNTPLMLACDKSHTAFLQYFVETYFTNPSRSATGDDDSTKKKVNNNSLHTCIISLIGHPMQQSPDSGNSAIHYAAMSGSETCLAFLAKILHFHQQRIDSQLNVSEKLRIASPPTLLDCYIQLLSQRNDNGDTPTMMASIQQKRLPCQNNLLEYWLCELKTIGMSYGEDPYVNYPPKTGSFIRDIHENIQKLLLSKNHSNDTVLSLACGHGNVSIVNTLVLDRSGWYDATDSNHKRGASTDRSMVTRNIGAFVPISYTDIERCKKALLKTDQLRQTLNEKHNRAISTKHQNQEEIQAMDDTKKQYILKECEKRYVNIKRCLVTLQVYAAKQSQQARKELLNQSDVMNDIDQAQLDQSSTKKNRKNINDKKKKKKSKAQQRPSKSIEMEPKDVEDHFTNSTNVSKPFFITSNDGSVLSSNNILSKSERVLEHGRESTSEMPTTPTSSKKSYLATAVASSLSSTEQYFNSAAEMDSLCLDPSMLLLNPHGLAFLSPSQLEAIENILKKQLDAVEEARTIHRRMKANMKKIDA